MSIMQNSIRPVNIGAFAVVVAVMVEIAVVVEAKVFCDEFPPDRPSGGSPCDIVILF